MKLRIFKPATAVLVVLLAIANSTFAQVAPLKPDTAAVIAPVAPIPPADTAVAPEPVAAPVTVTATVNTKALRVHLHQLKTQLKSLNVTTNAQVTAALNNISVQVNAGLSELGPQIAMGFKDYGKGDSYSQSDKQNSDSEKIKNYSKTYSIGSDDQLSVNNKYGTVTVNTWDKNEFKVDVQIKVDASSDDDAKQMLDNINISDGKDGSTILFKTNIGSESGSWSWGRHSVHKMEINYTVYMPSKNALKVDNSYGATILPNFDGRVMIKSAYGSFAAKALTAFSDIDVQYGSASIESLGTSNLKVAYGSLHLGSSDILKTDISYSSADIGTIHSAGDITLKYSGSLKIADIDRNLKHLAISSSYSNVNIGLSGDENANFDINTHYGEFDYAGQNITISSKSPDDSDRGPHFTYNYKGYLGKGSSDKFITISANYGNIKFE